MPTFFAKDLKCGRKGRFAREVLKDASIKNAFDKIDEQKLMVEAVKKFAAPGKKVTNDVLRRASGYMATKGIIDKKEQMAFEKLVTAGPRHTAYKEERKLPAQEPPPSISRFRSSANNINKNTPLNRGKNPTGFSRPAGLGLSSTRLGNAGFVKPSSPVKR